MGYLSYSVIFACLAFAISLVLWRHIWLPYLFAPTSLASLPSFPTSSTASHLYQRLPTFTTTGPSSFASDAEAGLHSSNFNLAENIEGGDDRQGLDEAGKKQVLRIMKRNKGMNFDEARRTWMQERFRKAGIAEDGRPRDPKFVSFS